MDALVAALEATALAEAMRVSRWGYAAANTGHVLGIALLVGAIVPLDLRMLGLWRSVPMETLARVLVPVAACGLALALVTGALLFLARPAGYAALTLFRTKLVLIVVGATSALAIHAVHGFRLETLSNARARLTGAVSLTAWLGALIAGRLLAFVE